MITELKLRRERIKKLELTIKEFEPRIVQRIRNQKSKLKTCPSCGSKINKEFVKKVSCVCCGSKDFGYTKTDKVKLEVLKKELQAKKAKYIKELAILEKKKAEQKVNPIKRNFRKVIEEEKKEEPSKWGARITEYNSDGEPEDSFSEWFYWEGYGNPTVSDASMELGYPEKDIIMLTRIND